MDKPTCIADPALTSLTLPTGSPGVGKGADGLKQIVRPDLPPLAWAREAREGRGRSPFPRFQDRKASRAMEVLVRLPVGNSRPMA